MTESKFAWSVTNKTTLRLIALVLVMLVLSTLALMPANPRLEGIPHRDSATYLYYGQQLLRGELPYRDLWAHSPPGIWYIDALGLLLGGGSEWGVWALELISLTAAASLCYVLLKEAFGRAAALFGVLGWLAGFIHIINAGGNMTEEWLQPWYFLAVFSLWRSEQSAHPNRWAVVIGAASAVGAIIRLNAIGLPFGIGMYLIISYALRREWRTLLIRLGWILAGGLSVIALLVVFLAANGVLGDFYETVFAFNAGAYSSLKLWKFPARIMEGIRVYARIMLSPLVVTAYLAGGVYVWLTRGQPARWKLLVFVVLLSLPVELFSTAYAGRFYAHYAMTWLPHFALLLGFMGLVLRGGAAGHDDTAPPALRTVRTVVLFGLMGFVLYRPGGFVYSATRNTFSPDAIADRRSIPAEAVRYQTIDYIQQRTDEEDYILFWGYEPLYFSVERRSPSRFVVNHPVYHSEFATPEIVYEYLNDIKTHQPAMIIDVGITHGYPSFDPERRQQYPWLDTLLPAHDELFEYVNEHYEQVDTIETPRGPWYIYEPVE